ncbi:MAG TPA: alpha-amylase family glycosyl hydrolase [Streptosporangiaceae bacterium]|nr:alpha-amylase family glycosyl hydrolase [Streptosporangiaceae bacterium]
MRHSEPWWHGAVLYQLYVRSWQDTNEDGYGDLRGIIERLDHLVWLGVDGIWLSPTMPSPDADWGYDVSDYTNVHPELGTLADLDELIAAAADRGMRVLLDLVPNHTSSAHQWFVDASSGPNSEHRDYYVWADPDPGGGPPSNWLDATGRTAWQLDDRSGQYYLHNYLSEQPDLNWWQPAIHREFQQILQFWFDRGVAGFRIDVAHGLYKDKLLRDNPPAEDETSLDNRFGLLSVYSANRPETHGVYRDWRQLAERYPAPKLLLGETWTGDYNRLAQFYGDNDELQLAFNFPFTFAEFTAPALPDVVEKTLAHLPSGACPVWMASNHDVGRFATRWCGDDERKIRLALLVLATLPGTVVLYYGDEIGMANVKVPDDLRRDRMSIEQPFGGRDRGRTPMQWDASAGAGFTAQQVRPWLPIGDNTARNVAAQRADADSTLTFCRDLIALRHAEFGNSIAAYEALRSAPDCWAYRAGDLVVQANFSDQRQPGHPVDQILLASSGQLPSTDGVMLQPWQGLIGRRAGQ